LGEGSYEQAIKLCREIEARYPYGRYARSAQFEVAYEIQVRASRRSDRRCGPFLKLHPYHPNAVYAINSMGSRLQRGPRPARGFFDQVISDATEGAQDFFDTFAQLVNRFPESASRLTSASACSTSSTRSRRTKSTSPA